MSEYQYTLKKCRGTAQKITCPDCGARNKFVPYINTETGEIVADHVGRCDREVNCGYHYKPAQYFEDNNIDGYKDRAEYKPRVIEPPKPTSYIPFEYLRKSRAAYESNNLVKYLLTVFDAETVTRLIELYNIGTSKYQFRNKEYPDYVSTDGACIFWQIDTDGKVRTGKIFLYDATTGRRIKQPFDHITWVHCLWGHDKNEWHSRPLFPGFNLSQCYFGAHLVKLFPDKPVALVESEKTALIASVYYPKFNWLACGSLRNINAIKCAPLANKDVVFFPDLNGFDVWKAKADELNYIANITVSDALEQIATEDERAQGLDIADYLLRFPAKEFTLRNALKDEFLIGEGLAVDQQESTVKKYLQLGLSKQAVKQVINELLKEHEFQIG